MGLQTQLKPEQRWHRGSCYCALSPCGRGLLRRFNGKVWVRGEAATPHPAACLVSPTLLSPARREGTTTPAAFPAPPRLPMRFRICDAVGLARRTKRLGPCLVSGSGAKTLIGLPRDAYPPSPVERTTVRDQVPRTQSSKSAHQLRKSVPPSQNQFGPHRVSP